MLELKGLQEGIVRHGSVSSVAYASKMLGRMYTGVNDELTN